MLGSYDKFDFVETERDNKLGNPYEKNDAKGSIITYQGLNP